jgi:hypothetical protein
MSRFTDIGVRRINYACCSLEYLKKYVKARKYGDKSCDINRRLWLYMLWAKGVMDNTPQDASEENGAILVAEAGTVEANGYYVYDGVDEHGHPVYRLSTDPNTYISPSDTRLSWTLMYGGVPIYSSTDFPENPWDADWTGGLVVTLNSTSKCNTWAFAQAVMQKADCFCSSCGCSGSPYPPPADFCAPTVSDTVLGVADTGDEAAITAGPPAVGAKYFVVTNNAPGITWVKNQLVTWNGATWDAVVNPHQGVVADASTNPNTLWTTYDNVTPGQLFPPITMTFIGPATYEFQTTAPQIAAYTGRTVQILLLTTGGWVAVAQIPEADIVAPYSFDATGFSFTEVGAMYIAGDCSWVAPIGEILPVGCTFPRDHDCLDHNTTDHS